MMPLQPKFEQLSPKELDDSDSINPETPKNMDEVIFETWADFLNDFFDRIVQEVLKSRSLNEYEKFYVDHREQRYSEFDLRKTSKDKGTPGPEIFSNKIVALNSKESEADLDIRRGRTSFRDDGFNKEDLRIYTMPARDLIDGMSSCHKINKTTIYLRKIRQQLIYILKI
mmetsp:Transcript_16957/g.14851  ORF Transcript_16957/g.14851 Transcript_16957/m.14851 type:complete len:170 (-) Transcript_16957:12-521(-)